MRFSNKLFFAMTALMTMIFTLFGVWIISSFFSNLLNRELEQGSIENQMFQYVFELAYKGVPREYGEEYSMTLAVNSVMDNLSNNGNVYYIFDENNEPVYGGEESRLLFLDTCKEIQANLDTEQNYGSHVVQDGKKYYLISSCKSEETGRVLYLAMRKDITSVFEDRRVLLGQYRLALMLLLFLGTVGIFALSRYITRPIQELNRVARSVAEGKLQRRSKNRSGDEIGQLAGSFNRMADELVERMQEKEREAQKKEEEARQKDREARQKALEAKQQEDFTAAFAHELKTPLTSIIGYADMLSSLALTPEEISEAAYYIFTQGKRLESLSHKLLELVSMDRHSLEKKEVSAKELEENIRITCRPLLKKKQINGRVMLEKAKFSCDKELLLSLLYNLIDNASKAVEPGGFVLLKGSVQGQEYEFKVVDNGRGIPEEEIARITEAFYMVDKSRSRKEGGAGIGMALCQRIVNLHQGTMQIDSKVGKGTVVRVTIPL